MPGTISHVLSMTTPNDPAYENQPKHWNSSHLATFNLSGSEISNAFGNGGGVSFGLSADGNITASAPAAAASPINFSAGTTSNNLGSVVFADSNGVGFGLGTGASSRSITASYTQSTHAHTAWPVAFSAGTQTATSGTPGFANSNNFTFGMSGSSQITASFSESTHAHTAWPLGFSAGTQTATSGTPGLANSNNFTFGMSGSSQITASFSESTHAHTSLSFSNLNGVTFGIAGSTLTASVAAGAGGIAAGISNTGNTAGNTGTVSSGTLVFAASGGITASQSTAAGQSTIWYSVAAPVAQTTQSAIEGFGVSNTGNTAGNTGISTGIDWVLAGSSPITLSQSTAAGTNTVWIQAPATSSLVGTSGLSISTSGSTISVYPKALSAWDPYPIITGTGSSSHAPASAWFSKMNLDCPVAVSFANVFKSLNVSAPGMSSQNSSLTNKFSYSHGLTIFTRQDFAGNSTNMSQWTTASFGMTGSLSQSSSSASVALSWVTNSTGGTTSFSTTSASNLWTNFFTGQQMFRIPLVTTLTPGEYFLGQQHSSTTATVGSNFTLLSVSNIHVVPQSMTIATITSSGSLGASSPDGLGIGIASAVTTNNTMAISVISAATQNWWYMNFSNI